MNKKKTLLPIVAVAASVGVLYLLKKNADSSPLSGIGATNDALAYRLIEEAGLDLNKSYFELSWSEVYELTNIMKKCKYRPAKNAPGSPARMFWQRLKRKY